MIYLLLIYDICIRKYLQITRLTDLRLYFHITSHRSFFKFESLTIWGRDINPKGIISRVHFIDVTNI